MSMKTLLLIVAGLALLGVIRTMSYSRNWGYGPSIAAVVLVILILLVMLDYV